LAETLQRNRVACQIGEVLRWADQLLDALDYLHTQETPIIHRDIKPQNLKLTPRGQIILLDFGLAKGTVGQMSISTGSGSIFGYTPHYAPLEQIQGTGTDQRSDLYSLAATLYHLMTNMKPPDALARATSVLSGHSDPLFPASKINPQVSSVVADVLHRAMSLNPSQRPLTAAAMRVQLRNANEHVQPYMPETMVASNIKNASIQQDELNPSPRSPSPSPAGVLSAEQTQELKSTISPLSEQTLVFNHASKRALTPSPQAAIKQQSGRFLSIAIISLLAIVSIVVALGGFGYFVSSNQQSMQNANAATKAANTKQYVNTREGRSGSLADNFVDFSFYYPDNWVIDPHPEPNFVRVERELTSGGGDFTQENFAVGWVSATGTALDKQLMPQLVKQFNTQFAAQFPNYKKVSEGETKIGPYDGYEFRFTAEKNNVNFWGRVAMLPPPAGQKKGVALVMIASDRAPELSGTDDVGEKGELPVILESFRFGSDASQ
ncbi:MAG TPA: protein kinase, partial [Pyrinomonadaceae bacterium]